MSAVKSKTAKSSKLKSKAKQSKRTSISKTKAAKKKSVKLLTGGNPQIPKGDGDEPVQAYIAAMPGWKSAVGKRLDALIVRHLPRVQKAVRWNSPFFGLEGQGWLVSFHVLTRCVQVNFFCGAKLKPLPPLSGKDPNSRWLNINEHDEFPEAQLETWLKQAAKLKGWASFAA